MFNKEKPVEIIVDKEKCRRCGTCIEICPSYLQKDANGYPEVNDKSDFGCIQCGYCMMSCPHDAFEVKGQDVSKNYLRQMYNELPNFEAINALFMKRRSARKFKEEEVQKEEIEKILSAAATAAISIPPSEVKVLVFQGRAKVEEFRQDLIDGMKGFIKFAASPLINIMRLFGKTQYKMFKEFVIPLCKILLEDDEKGFDHLFYNAPAVLVFYGTEYIDREDMILAANQATIAAEAMGLGTCYIGMVPPMLEHNKKLKQKYGIRHKEKVGIAFILGYPVTKFRKTIQRHFKEVKYIE